MIYTKKLNEALEQDISYRKSSNYRKNIFKNNKYAKEVNMKHNYNNLNKKNDCTSNSNKKHCKKTKMLDKTRLKSFENTKAKKQEKK